MTKKKKGYKPPTTYYCYKCKKRHQAKSKIGRKHRGKGYPSYGSAWYRGK